MVRLRAFVPFLLHKSLMTGLVALLLGVLLYAITCKTCSSCIFFHAWLLIDSPSVHETMSCSVSVCFALKVLN